MGVCGGLQMLGRTIIDPHHVEPGGSSKGLELLNVETELLAHKRTIQIRAYSFLGSWGDQSLVEGYEIHMGVTVRGNGVLPCFQIISHSETFPSPQSSSQEAGEFQCLDGAMSSDGLVWGTYIHGVFDQPGFRRVWLNRVRVRKNLPPLDEELSQSVSGRLVEAIDGWADHVGTYLNMKPIFSAIEMR